MREERGGGDTNAPFRDKWQGAQKGWKVESKPAAGRRQGQLARMVQAHEGGLTYAIQTISQLSPVSRLVCGPAPSTWTTQNDKSQ